MPELDLKNDILRKNRSKKRDRYMTLRGATYYYMRHRTIDVVELDKKQPQIRLLLKTDDLAEVQTKRDVLERADNHYWTPLFQGHYVELPQKI